jgi:hypothetical protein
VTLPQFNPMLGTLTGITAALDSRIAGSVAIENRLPTQSFGWPFNQVTTLLSLPNIGVLQVRPQWAGIAGQLAPFDGTNDFAGLDSISDSGTGFDATSAAITNLSGYIGTGDVIGSLDVSVGVTSGTYAYSFVSAYNVTNANAFITYTYNPAGGVPEPASWAMLITGFGLTGLAARRRRRTAAAVAQ